MTSKRAAAKAATCSRVLAAARAVFIREGYETATIRLIAREAGVSTGAIFNSFDSKEDLWTAATGLQTPEQWAKAALVAVAEHGALA